MNQSLNKEHIKDIAYTWIGRLDRGLSPQEKTRLVTWMREAEFHSATMLKLASFWDNPHVLNELSSLYPLDQDTINPLHKYKNIAIAATLLLFSLIGADTLLSGQWSQYHRQQLQHQAQTFSTVIGEQNAFSLSDGSRIVLNTNSVVRIDYTPQHRKLTLVQGEANFDVAKDKHRPFTVQAGTQYFTALGTVFNIQKNDEKNVELVVTEGRVLIAETGSTLLELTRGLSQLADAELTGIIVTQGEKATIKPQSSTPIAKIDKESIERELAWQQGILIFEGESLSSALLEVSRYTNITFSIADPTLESLKVAGYFRAGDVDGLLMSLNCNFDIIASKTAQQTVVLRRDNHIVE